MKYSSNISEVLTDLTNDLKQIDLRMQDQLIIGIGNGLLSSNINRIHLNGKAVDGGDIGKYSTDPIYVNPSKSPKAFNPMGKGGQTGFKFSSSKRKTKYFEDGYQGFRQSVGRDVSKVNLNLTGKLLAEFGLDIIGDGVVLGPTTDYAKTLIKGNEERFGKVIWGVTITDEKNIDKAVDVFLDSLGL